MTKEDVLSGMKFKWKGSVYSYQDDSEDPGHGCLLTEYGRYECNAQVGPTTLRWYTFVLDRRVRGRIRYEDLELAIV